MTDIFRSDILAVVMNQLVDEPNLPTLFLRTVSIGARVLLSPPADNVIGYSSSDYVSLTCRLCLHDSTYTPDHEEDLD